MQEKTWVQGASPYWKDLVPAGTGDRQLLRDREEAPWETSGDSQVEGPEKAGTRQRKGGLDPVGALM